MRRSLRRARRHFKDPAAVAFGADPRAGSPGDFWFDDAAPPKAPPEPSPWRSLWRRPTGGERLLARRRIPGPGRGTTPALRPFGVLRYAPVCRVAAAPQGVPWWPPAPGLDIKVGVLDGTLGPPVMAAGRPGWLTASHVASGVAGGCVSTEWRPGEPAAVSIAQVERASSLRGGPTCQSAVPRWGDLALLSEAQPLPCAPVSHPTGPRPAAWKAVDPCAWVHPEELQPGNVVALLGSSTGLTLGQVSAPFGVVRVNYGAGVTPCWLLLQGQVLVAGKAPGFGGRGDSGGSVVVALDTSDLAAVEADPGCTRWGLLGCLVAGPTEPSDGISAITPLAAALEAWGLDVGLPRIAGTAAPALRERE